MGEREVSSKVLGEIVMTELKDMDDVIAYVRFASVYRDFKTLMPLNKSYRAYQIPPIRAEISEKIDGLAKKRPAKSVAKRCRLLRL